MQVTRAGDSGLYIDLGEVSFDDLHRAARFAQRLPGVAACIVGQRTLLLLFDATPPDPHIVEKAILIEAERIDPANQTRTHTIPVDFADTHGLDLERLLAHAQMTRERFFDELLDLRLRARFLGFRAGFAYLEGIPETWHLPRRSEPRLRVPRGSFAIAGPMAAFYPIDSPGGWNILGRSDVELWNARRTPPNLIAAGDTIEFRIADSKVDHLGKGDAPPSPGIPENTHPVAMVVDPGQLMFALGLPDDTRYRYGLPPGGAFNEGAARSANLAVGNDQASTVLECLMVGPTIRFERDSVVSWYGAIASIEIDGVPVTHPKQFSVSRGQTLRIGRLGEGARGILALRGGWKTTTAPFDVAPEPIVRGSVLEGQEAVGAPPRLRADPGGDRLTIHAIAGPHEVAEGLIEQITRVEWKVTNESDRVGLRLRSTFRPSEIPATLPSCGLQIGSIQWHPNGDLVVMGPDHPITGGYLQPLTVSRAERWKLATLSPGDSIRLIQNT